jgi:hypothetical protein
METDGKSIHFEIPSAKSMQSKEQEKGTRAPISGEWNRTSFSHDFPFPGGARIQRAPVSLAAIASVSTALQLLSPEDLEGLLVRAREHKRAVGVAGVLLYHDGHFFQFIEGPQWATAAMHRRIRPSRLHKYLYQRVSGPVQNQFFPICRWALPMCLNRSSPGLLL